MNVLGATGRKIVRTVRTSRQSVLRDSVVQVHSSVRTETVRLVLQFATDKMTVVTEVTSQIAAWSVPRWNSNANRTDAVFATRGNVTAMLIVKMEAMKILLSAVSSFLIFISICFLPYNSF